MRMPHDAPVMTAALTAEVLRAEHVCAEHIRIACRAPGFPASEPGQFAQLDCRGRRAQSDHTAIWPNDGFPSPTDDDLIARVPYLRRPFSIADHMLDRDGAARLTFISRNVGGGTDWLDHVKTGDTLNITGPLGRGFRIPEPDTPLILVGGGVGIPPLLYLARRLAECGHDRATVIFGVMSQRLLPLTLTDAPSTDGSARPCIELPGNRAYPTIITSDDGTIGLSGRVTDALALLRATPSANDHPHVLACGPDAMLKAVAHQTRAWSWPCQLCIERQMGCGFGTCLSCIVRAVDQTSPQGWRWRLACTDGPVFDRDELLDYAQPPAP